MRAGFWLSVFVMAWAPPFSGAAEPPLAPVSPVSLDDERERHQLGTATDGRTRLDEPALYPLLRDVIRWQAGEPRRAWVEPDYQQLHDDPAAHRGELLQIEGEFFDRTVRHRLQRPGEWGEAVTAWGVAVERDPPRLAIVLLVDPDGRWHGTDAAPRIGQHVRVTARFYKLWTADAPDEGLTDYLVFVGRYPQVTGGGGSAPTGIGPGQVLVMVLVLVGLMVFLLLRSRGISLRPRPLPRQLSGRAASVGDPRDVDAPAASDDGDADADADAPLPDDPADALRELERRGGGDA